MPKSLSGAQCVAGLLGLGFVIDRRGPGLTVLKLDHRRVVVPALGMLGPDMLRAILRSAGVEESELRGRIAPSVGRQPVAREANAPPSSVR